MALVVPCGAQREDEDGGEPHGAGEEELDGDEGTEDRKGGGRRIQEFLECWRQV
jgi:hypothetical protein